MPDLITNIQGQNSTVSDNGRNVRPDLSDFLYYTIVIIALASLFFNKKLALFLLK